MAYNPFRNFWLKAVAVGIATILWVAVGGEKIVERSLQAPLELLNRPPTLELVGDAPRSLEVRVRGTSTLVGRLTPGDVKAVLDVISARPGVNHLSISPDIVSAPFGVEVTYAGPAHVTLVFERLEIRSLPVKPDVDGEPAPGYEVRRVTVDPAAVEVIGPESAFRELSEAVTEPIELRASALPIREALGIAVLNSAARLRTPQKAVVTVDIQPVRTERVISGVPVRMPKLKAGLRAQSTPATVSVTVRGDDAELKTLGPGFVEAYVDVADLGPGRYGLQVRIAPSPLFGVTRIDPPQARITIR